MFPPLTRSEEQIYLACTTASDPRRQFQLNRHRDTFNDEAFEELKKIIILAAIIFMGTIVVVLTKMQVPTEDVIRWSPIIWLIGVICAGVVMNFIFHCRKIMREKRRKRRQAQTELLLSLPLPSSFPCLAPPPHTGCCGRHQGAPPSRTASMSKESLPAYEEIAKSACTIPPPDYSAACALLLSSRLEPSTPTSNTKSTQNHQTTSPEVHVSPRPLVNYTVLSENQSEQSLGIIPSSLTHSAPSLT